jgi:hypothetical protein
MKLVQEQTSQNDINDIVREIVLTLAGQSNLILYEQPLQLPEEPARMEGTLLEKIIDEMTRLLAMGKIDVDTKMTAKFIGDKRVLADIKLLAESGYGEDKFGNNTPLPEKLFTFACNVNPGGYIKGRFQNKCLLAAPHSIISIS